MNVTKNSIKQTKLAERWGVSERTIERWRSIGCGPKFHKMGGRVVYMMEDVEAYEAATAMHSTSCPVNTPAGGES